MPKKNDQDDQLDLNEAIDSLLVEIEETTRSYAPPEEQAIDSDMMITDDGTMVAAPKPEEVLPDSAEEPESEHDAAIEAEAEDSESEDEVVDSIENAQQALDALDDVESQAEELVGQSIDSLLESSETATEIDLPEAAAVPEPETQDQVDDQVDATDDEATLVDADESIPEMDDADDSDEVPSSEAETQQPAAVIETFEEPAAIDEPDEVAQAQPEPSGETETEQPKPAPAPKPKVAETEESLLKSEVTSTEALDESMDMLDNALAEAADDMLDGDFETEEGELVSGEAVASAIEEAIESQADQEPEDDSEPEPNPEYVSEPAPESESESADDPMDESDILGGAVDDLLGSGETSEAEAKADPIESAAESTPSPAAAPVSPDTTETPSDEPQEDPVQAEQTTPVPDQETQAEIENLESIHAKESQPVPAWFERSIEIARPWIDKIDPLKGKTMDAVAMVLGTSIVAVKTHGTPLAAIVMIQMSRPLANKPAELRNAIGYIALWTGFLAVVLWVYLLMFRTPNVPHPETAPSRVINADESLVIPPLLPVTP